MQRSITILFGIILSTLIIYGGSGVNAYFYCCGNCKSVEWVSNATRNTCCIEQQSQDLEKRGCTGCIDSTSHGATKGCSMSAAQDGCGIYRIQFDWQSFASKQVQIQSPLIDAGMLFLACNFVLPGSNNYSVILPQWKRQTQKPPNLSKEDYFSLLTTLII